MRTHKMIVGAAAAVLLSACIPSVKPFYTQQDLVMDARLLGTWQAAVGSDGPQSWRFEEKGEDAYKLTVTEEGDKTGLFAARLFRLEQELFKAPEALSRKAGAPSPAVP